MLRQAQKRLAGFLFCNPRNIVIAFSPITGLGAGLPLKGKDVVRLVTPIRNPVWCDRQSSGVSSSFQGFALTSGSVQ